MPFINVKTNLPLKDEQKTFLKDELNKKISIIPGKSKNWLMINIEDSLDLMFSGTNKIAFYVEVKLYGSINENVANSFTSEVTKLLTQFSCPANRIYVSYFCTDLWGWSGQNF